MHLNPRRLFGPAALAFPLLVSGLGAQDWIQITTSSFAPVRDGQCTAYDLVHQKVVMFGGAMDGSVNGGLNDTWTWDGATWTQESPATVPPTRWLAAMDYDLARGTVLMFGGRIHAGPAGATGVRNDLWEWNGTDWVAIAATNPPPPRYSSMMVYDVARGVHVLFGGVDGNNVSFNETWEYNAGTQAWTQITTPTSPGGRVYAGIAYDLSRQRTVLYGGRDDTFAPVASTFWEYDGTNWTGVVPATTPGDMHSFVSVYDQIRQRVVMQGGRGSAFRTGTWEYDGVNCYQFNAEPNPLAPNMLAAGAYDLIRRRVVVCGGDNSSFSRTAVTWERDPDQASYALFGAGCPGSAGVPDLSALSLPAVGTTFSLQLANLAATPGLAYFAFGLSNTTWIGMPLPRSLASFGMPGCTGYVSVDGGALVGTTAGGALWSLAIPSSPALSGTRFFTQAISIEGAGGLAVSNAGAALMW
jgi:Galactose oxidase, central domain